VPNRPDRPAPKSDPRRSARQRSVWSWRIAEPARQRKPITASGSHRDSNGGNLGTDLGANLGASHPNESFRASVSDKIAAQVPPQTVDDYVFLVGPYLDAETLADAYQLARASNLMIHDVLISNGWISEEDYVHALGSALGLLVFMWGFTLPGDHAPVPPGVPPEFAGLGLWTLANGHWVFMLRATAATPRMVLALQSDHRLRSWPMALAPNSSIDAQLELAGRDHRLHLATDGLKRRTPGLSAALPATMAQRALLWLFTLVLGGGLLVAPLPTLTVLSALLGLPFVLVTSMRLLTLGETLRRAKPLRADHATQRISDDTLPTYSVLVPLFREADVLPDLVAALSRIDYPAGKLEVLLVLEAIDIETHAQLMTFNLPGHFRLVVVPDSHPRTKPKALNYALGLSHGEFVVVFDAEDRPEPDQLRDAMAAFRDAPTPLACVQAQLNIYNPHDSWFTRQFTIEYSALFDAILPMLAAYRLPIPLGGTSNHFPRAVLDHLGGWDPYNVTEDADLGIRLARLGWRTTIIASTTWEEAPTQWHVWYPQRTRWLKGWMQTYLVHTRAPIRLSRDLGFRQSIGLHVYIAGLILSSLAHPLMYVTLIAQGMSGIAFAPPDNPLQAGVWWGAWASLAIGYATSILVAVIAVARRQPSLTWSAVWMPLYWLLISFAAYRAVWQLYRDPFLWEKTPHGSKGKQRR
jgi:glycosyltransferase XagB